jgi:hypothetical protein
VIGEENCGELRTECLMERFEIARIANKSLLLVLSEAQKKRVENLLNESDSIRIFLVCSVKKTGSENSDLTVRQIVEAYNEFCMERGWDPIAVSIVERQLPDLMSELFGVLKSHDIKDGQKNVRGSHGVEFRSEDDQD